MNHAHPWQSYRRVATQTASPGQLVLLLFDGALRFLDRALAGFEHDDPLLFNQTINNNVLRAQEILSELNSSLDLARGGELAETLRQLYHYMDRRLTHSNLAKEPGGIRETIQRLTVLRDAWSQMLGQHAARMENSVPLSSSLCACG